jgi:hypothetical protein
MAGMNTTRWRAGAALAGLFAVAVVVVGLVVLRFVSTVPIHPDAASVPSTATATESPGRLLDATSVRASRPECSAGSV